MRLIGMLQKNRWGAGMVCLLPILLSLRVAAGQEEDLLWPERAWAEAGQVSREVSAELLDQARRYALTGNGSGIIVRKGRLLLAWGDQEKLYDLKSTTKSIGVTALGLALGDGRVALEDPAHLYQPALGSHPDENVDSGWIEKITIRHLATQSAGFEKPGGYTRILFEPGSRWDYSDSGPNWLAEVLTLLYRKDMEELLFDRVFTPIGIGREDLRWRKNAYRPEEIEGIARREFGSGVHANVDAMARIGLLYLRRGRWKDQQLLPPHFVDLVRHAPTSIRGLSVLHPETYGKASDHYGFLWWNNRDGTLQGIPRDAFWSWGLYDSLILVVPSLDLVVARAGDSWPRGDDSDHYDVLAPFFRPIVEAIGDRRWEAVDGAPYRPSSVLKGIEWAPADQVIRRAEGSDNWPLTWASDDRLYTAYGDGWGFEPKVPEKLSLGLAKIERDPPDFRGENIRSQSLETRGDGVRGKKASGILFLDGVLYLLARNAENAQLARSADNGQSWEWATWRFETSFGHPTFLNFGRNYDGAKDRYVYLYSHDRDSAYEAAFRMVLARVDRSRIAEEGAYEFFAGVDRQSAPVWSGQVSRRSSVFYHPDRCYRSQIHYIPSLDRYLWCQVMPGEDLPQKGGFAIYDSSTPWGPWTTVFYTENWDIGPGENCSIPAKWVDGEEGTFYMVFSGSDAFSVRRGRFLR